MKIKRFTVLDNGICLNVEEETTDKHLYLCTHPDFCPEDIEGFTVVSFKRGGYDSIDVIFRGKTTNGNAAVDLAADFLDDNAVSYNSVPYEDLLEMNIPETDGGFADYIPVGNGEPVYILTSDLSVKTCDALEV